MVKLHSQTRSKKVKPLDEAQDVFHTGICWFALSPLFFAIGFSLLRFSIFRNFEEFERFPQPDLRVYNEADCPYYIERVEHCNVSINSVVKCQQRTRLVASRDISSGELLDVAPVFHVDVSQVSNPNSEDMGQIDAFKMVKNISHVTLSTSLSLVLDHQTKEANVVKKKKKDQLVVGPYRFGVHEYKATTQIVSGSPLVITEYNSPQSKKLGQFVQEDEFLLGSSTSTRTIVEQSAHESQLDTFNQIVIGDHSTRQACGLEYTRIHGCGVPHAFNLRGDELVARRNFLKGQIITVSPVLTVGATWVETCRPRYSGCSKLIWYKPDMGKAFAVFGIAAFVRPHSTAGNTPNVRYSILDLRDGQQNRTSCPPPGSLQLQIEAKRNISVGEILIAELGTTDDYFHTELDDPKQDLRKFILATDPRFPWDLFSECFQVPTLSVPQNVNFHHPLLGNKLMCSNLHSTAIPKQHTSHSITLFRDSPTFRMVSTSMSPILDFWAAK